MTPGQHGAGHRRAYPPGLAQTKQDPAGKSEHGPGRPGARARPKRAWPAGHRDSPGGRHTSPILSSVTSLSPDVPVLEWPSVKRAEGVDRPRGPGAGQAGCGAAPGTGGLWPRTAFPVTLPATYSPLWLPGPRPVPLQPGPTCRPGLAPAHQEPRRLLPEPRPPPTSPSSSFLRRPHLPPEASPMPRVGLGTFRAVTRSRPRPPHLWSLWIRASVWVTSAAQAEADPPVLPQPQFPCLGSGHSGGHCCDWLGGRRTPRSAWPARAGRGARRPPALALSLPPTAVEGAHLASPERANAALQIRSQRRAGRGRVRSRKLPHPTPTGRPVIYSRAAPPPPG